MPRTARVDDVDRRIVAALQRDGRRPFTSIGRELGLSEAAVRQRVARQWSRIQIMRINGYRTLTDVLHGRRDPGVRRITRPPRGWHASRYSMS